MGGKKNHYRKNNPPPPPPPKIEINQEELLNQCLQIHELLKDRTAKLRKLQTGDFCFILSTKWLRDWKDFVAYEHTLGEDTDQKSKDKHFGRRSPGKINSDLLASSHEAGQFYGLPAQMKEYDFLRQIINEKRQKDVDYIAVTEDIWLGFLQFYEGEAISRPVRKTKGSIFYDSDLLRIDTIIVNLEDEQLSERVKKTPKKSYSDFFPSDKMLLSSLWDTKALYSFMQAYCKYEYGFDKVRIWKGFGYMATNPITENLVESIKDKEYKVKARLITPEKYREADIDDYLKSTHTLIVEIGEALKEDKVDDKLYGYCEECVKKSTLTISCVCGEVIYCSNRCRIDDQSYHHKTCSKAFDSDDDEEYDKASTVGIPKAGLDNLGNTCYMNSTLQALFSLDYLRQFFTSNDYLKHLDEKELAESNCVMLRKLSKGLKQLCEEESVATPWAIKGQIDYNLTPFKGYKQHDANDFLVNFINTINDHLSKHPDKPFHRIFQPLIGEFHSKVICPHCNVKSQNNQIFMQLSLPIKTKAKVQAYSYAIAQSPSRIVRGRANLQQTWPEIKKALNLPPETLVFCTKEPEGLVMVDEEEKSPEKAVKGLKGELVFFKNVPSVENEYLFVVSQVTTRVICGSKMKSPMGSPYLISLNDVSTTMGTLWLKIIRTYFYLHPEIVERAQQMETQYFAQITEAIQKDNQIKMKEESTQSSSKGQPQEEKESQLCVKVVEHFNERLKLFSQQIGIQIYLAHYRRHKNMCKFCNKKCQNCDMPKTFDQSFQDFFRDKYQQVRFQVCRRQPLQLNYEQVDLSSTGDPTLQDCLSLFNEPEQLDEENAWYCSNCDSMALALKELEVRMFPPVLIIHLNRFKNHEGKKIKNSDPILYHQFQVFDKHDYRLVGVIVHEGSMDTGHYWSICLRDSQYYVFNDSKVTPIEKVYNRNAYILIYSSMNFQP